MILEEKVLDRIEQSFEIFRKSFTYLVVPFFCYYLLSFVFFGLIMIYLLFSGTFLSIFDTMDYNNFFLFFTNPKVVFLIFMTIVLGILYLLIYIPFFIYSIKTIWDFYKWAEKINFKDNLMFSLTKFMPLMKTYWYIFAYVALIPSLFFIAWGILFNLSYFLNFGDLYSTIWVVFMSIWAILFAIFAIYRWLKTSFSVFSAVDSDDYSRENFKFSVEITKNKWWRILWNIFLIWLIVWLLSWMASNFFSIFFGKTWSFSNMDFNSLNKETIQNLINSFSFFNYFVSWFFEMLISTIWKIFILIFIYIFYKRLSFETIKTIENTENRQGFEIKNENKEVEL